MFEGDISTITPLGLVFTLVMGILMYVLPRRYAPIPMIMAGCYITLGQMVYVAGLHFSVMRIMILVGWLRVITRKEFKEIKFNRIDKALLVWAFASAIMYNIQWQTYDAFINRLGFLYNALGLYFLFRCLIRNLDEVIHAIKMLAFIIMPFALLMLYEKVTGHNMFSVFGGVPEFTLVRDGRLRCQGPFRHPILAGTLGATLMPCFAGLWFVKGARLYFHDRIGICNDHHNNPCIEWSGSCLCVWLDCSNIMACQEQHAHHQVGLVVCDNSCGCQR